MAKKQSRAKLSKDVIVHNDRKCAKTLSVLARELGVDLESLKLLQKAPGCPGRNRGHLYDIEGWREFYGDNEKHLGELAQSGPGIEQDTKAYHEKRKVAAQANILELKLREEEGSIAQREEVVQVVGELLTNLSRELIQKPKESGAELLGLPLPEFNKRLGEMHREAIERVIRGFEGKKKVFWQKFLPELCDLLQKSSPGDGPSDG
jgi:hypothetical protein